MTMDKYEADLWAAGLSDADVEAKLLARDTAMTRYVLVTAESLATALAEATWVYGPHRKQADAILAAHPREATDALFAVVEGAREFLRRYDNPTAAFAVNEYEVEPIRKALAALREHIAPEDGP